MSEELKLKLTGFITIYIDGVEILNRKNSIQPGALDVIRKAITQGLPNISKVFTFDDSTFKGESQIIQHSYLTTPGTVKYTTIFDEASFSGWFNGLELVASDNTVFSKIIGITPIEKTSDNKITIEWVLKIETI